MSGLPVVSLDEGVQFLESVVIPSFDGDRELKTSKERKEWMRLKAEKYLTIDKANELMDRFSTISTLEMAEEKERLLEAKQERQQQHLSAGNSLWIFYFASPF
jgi:hypothetical protein